MWIDPIFRQLAACRSVVSQGMPTTISITPWALLFVVVGLPSIAEPAILGELWWLLLLASWTFPRPLLLADGERCRGDLAIVIVGGAILGWLVYRTESALVDILGSWRGILGWHWQYPVSSIIRLLMASATATVAVAFPTWRIFKRRAVAVTRVAALTCVLLVGYRSAIHFPGVSVDLVPGAINLSLKAVLPALLVILMGFGLAGIQATNPQSDDSDAVDRCWERIYGRAVSLWWTGAVGALFALVVAAFEYQSASTRLANPMAWVVASAIGGLLMLPLAGGIFCRLADLKRSGFVAANAGALCQLILAAAAVPLIFVGLIGNASVASYLVAKAVKSKAGAEWYVAITYPTVIRISGEFTPGLGQRVEREIQQHPALRLVALQSPGGDLEEGYRVAEAIHAHHLATTVDSYCDSACTIAFVAGSERILEKNAHLGFHKCAAELWFQNCTKESAEQEKTFEALGIDSAFIHKALQVPNSSVWYPTAEELKAAHVITATVLKSRSELTPDERTVRDAALAGRASTNLQFPSYR